MHDLTLADAIKFLRTKKGLSARRLSLSARLSPSYVGKVEAGELSPSFTAFCGLMKALAATDAEILFLIRLQEEAIV